MTEAKKPTAAPAPQPDNNLAVISFILGLVSFMGPLIVTGLPAVIIGIVALAKKQGGKAFSITGIVAGSIATLITLAIVALFVLVFALGAWSLDSAAPYFEQQTQDVQRTPQEA